VSLREPGRNLQIQSTAPLNVSGSHFRTRRAKPQRPLCPDETCMEVTALKDQAETCRHFADRTIAERGVRYGRVATTPTSAKTKRHPKAYLAIETPVVACPFRVIRVAPMAARLRRMSAMPSMATDSVRRNEPTRCATLNRPGGNSDPRWSNLKKGQGRRYSRRLPGLGFRYLWQ